ncbi:MAG: G8 domain-containing protein [Cyanobacteriota bacterium SKYGB_h_bin112]|nr:G8 domain-containing protein [Cyanobacteriota bacterium SKYGB_h_bin112]
MSNQHSSMTHSHAHANDPAKQSEHEALLNLVPHAAATHVAVRDGLWSDPTTWQGGRIPNNSANVLIPTGIDVIYNVESNARLRTVRIDGTLTFAHDRNTKMVVDTLVNAPSGTLTIGRKEQPIQGDKTARIVIANNGAIDLNWDPQQLSRGVLSHGKVEIHGQEKTSHLRLAQDAMRGATQLVLAEVPKNWKVGDSIVLTGTYFVPNRWTGSELVWQGTQDEELKITAINGNRITIDRPLQYNHDAPRADLKAYVANYSRNVIIETENYAALPNSQRGHVMFMHNDAVDVRYAEFFQLGRTDKSKYLDDFQTRADGTRILDASGNPIKNSPTSITNPRGRYAFHLHRTGVENLHSHPAMVIGNAVWGSPGFGFAHHDSYAVFENNAAYNVFGSAFVAETGNEIGVWRNNIAIKSEGTLEISKDVRRVENHDIGSNGVGFWLQGRLIIVENNVAAGQRHAGFTYMMRGVDNLKALANNLDKPDVMTRYYNTVNVDVPPIQHFRNNETLTSTMGFEVIKNSPLQGHDVRSVIDGLKAWEVNVGTHQEYTSKYTLKNLDLLGTRSSGAMVAKVGIEFHTSTSDMVVGNSVVAGFDTGINLKKVHTLGNLSNWDFAFLNVDLTRNGKALNNFDPRTDKILTSSQLQTGRLELVLSPDCDFIFDTSQGREVVIKGVKHDSLGSISYPGGLESDRLDFNILMNRLAQGHYVDRNGTRFITFKDAIADRVTAQLREYTFIVVLDNTWNSFTFSGALSKSPRIATYNGIAQPGIATPDILTFLAAHPVPYAPVDNPRIYNLGAGAGHGGGHGSGHGSGHGHDHSTHNHPPTAIALSGNSVAENAAGAIIGTLTVSDIDANDRHTFTVSDNRFEVVNNQLKLKAGVSLDYETTPQINLSITATDSGNLSKTQAFTINVTDVPENIHQGLSLASLRAYAPGVQDITSTTSLSNQNTAVSITGNGWKALTIDKTITRDTILSFEFRSDALGEIHGIGFDQDTVFNAQEEPRFFKLLGTQNYGNRDFDGNYRVGDGWKAYTIPVGQFFTGVFNNLVLFNDHDVSNPTANSQFRNIHLYDSAVTLAGRAGADTLVGTSGNNIIVGGGGNDTLTGGAGSDRFVYNALSDGVDTITDFNPSEDWLDLRNLFKNLGYLGANPVADGFLRFTQSGNNTLVQIDSNGLTGGANFSTLATLTGVTASNLSVGNNVLV